MKEIRYHSTKSLRFSASFQRAFLQGLAPDGGLYMMDISDLPRWSSTDVERFSRLSYIELAETILWPFVMRCFKDRKIWRRLVERAYEKFAPQIQRATPNASIIWLRGPSHSFKDFAAFLYAQLLEYFLDLLNKYKAILTATSGDTGAAISAAVNELSRAFLIVLYPKGHISPGQRRQMTTMENTHAIETNGSFDVCQSIVYALLEDPKFAHLLTGITDFFTSANSINIGRYLPQAVYPFYAYGLAGATGDLMNYAIPSGNFGDAFATLVAKFMGLPVHSILCGLNDNTTFKDFLQTGEYMPQTTLHTPSSAQDVGNPGNMPRIFEAFGGNLHRGVVAVQPDLSRMRETFFATCLDEEGHYRVIKEVYESLNILLDPHGATAWHAYEEYDLYYDSGFHTLIYETADPGKFPDVIYRATGEYPEIPESMQAQASLPERIYSINAEHDIVDGKECGSAAQIAQAKELITRIYKESPHKVAMA